MTEPQRRRITADNPFIVADPLLGMLNLAGEAGQALLERDRVDMTAVFGERIVASTKVLPHCNVLFLYGNLGEQTHLLPHQFTLRTVIKTSRARVVVVASETPGARISAPLFGKCLSTPNDWPANIVITLNRNGVHFGRFFQRLFADMMTGTSMPMAWVRLAPQGPMQPDDIPGTMFLAEAGHIAFAPQKPAA